MSNIPQTPRTKASFDPSTPPDAHKRHDRLGTHVQASSPHYTTTRRHSLYGTEDRIIIDPGSRVWKVGFSGEGRPRDVFAVGSVGSGLWQLSSTQSSSEEEARMLEAKMQNHLRSVFHDSLLTDPKSRKVILVENPLLSISTKEMMARILFTNLQVPSISFAPSHLLSLLAVGRISGLVLDTGHLESTVLPVVSSRPLYPYLKTTPLAGSRLTSHIRYLLTVFGTYLPPPTSLSGAANIPTTTRSTRIPQEVLTDAVIEEIKTRCCFVGEALDAPSERSSTPLPILSDDLMSVDIPPSEPPSESGVSRVSGSMDIDLSRNSSSPSTFSEAIHHGGSQSSYGRNAELNSQAIAAMYTRYSTATELTMKVVPPISQQTGTGRGTLIIPGWIRERASELLFATGDVDESSVAEVILESLLKVPRDLRKDLASSILVVGGTAMLPGFIPRLHTELVRALTPRETRLGKRPHTPFLSLFHLLPYINILNHPSPPPPTTARSSAGRAPAFSPAALPWVGGSLAGALKTGGEEILRERWDEVSLEGDGPDVGMDIDPAMPKPTYRQSREGPILPDWSRSPLPAGAPSAIAVTNTPLITVS
ncbi:actin-domain-containing protein [Ramaria rubella]|nr:actin-domain-containing protein [Ramaria rubella]